MKVKKGFIFAGCLGFCLGLIGCDSKLSEKELELCKMKKFTTEVACRSHLLILKDCGKFLTAVGKGEESTQNRKYWTCSEYISEMFLMGVAPNDIEEVFLHMKKHTVFQGLKVDL